MKIQLLILTIISVVLYGCNAQRDAEVKDYVSYVNPLIGTGGHGHVFVGASLPHGMVQLGPNNLSKGWDWCSGYHDSDSTIIGFAHTHLSGTGIADLGDVLLMPVHGIATQVDSLSKVSYYSTFSKQQQEVVPGYYSVFLDKYRIKAELTATNRVGFHRYTYPNGVDAQVIIDLNESAQSLVARKGTLDSDLRQINDSTIVGYRLSDEWATHHKVYFAATFSKPIKVCKKFVQGKGTYALLQFGVQDNPLLSKVGISYTSLDGAWRNLQTEGAVQSFDHVRQAARCQWNEALRVIDFEAEADVTEIFYTALYHTMIAPSLFSDVNGEYLGADGNLQQAKGFVPYTVFSLWDTYRAVHPLYTMIDNRSADYVNSLLSIAEQQDSLPMWHLVGHETNCMVGLHSIPVIVDACLKDVSGIDKQRAYQVITMIDRMKGNGLMDIRSKGYIPADIHPWSVARGLEYAIDDYAIAQLAKSLGKEADYGKYSQRATNYKHYFDSKKGFMRGKLADGSRRKHFDPSHSIHLEDDYVEGNAWQYTWLVPHDVEGLVDLFGSKETFVSKLDSLFIVSSELNEGASADITGMIGQYAHGNEPSHHTLYLYAYVGQLYKSADLLRKVYADFYTTQPDGLIGNEDCGQMSAWYILSTLGFYPVNPVDGKFVFGSPLVHDATLHLINGKEFRVIAHNNSDDNRYIQSIKLNGKEYTESYITYQDIMKGGTLEYEMGNLKK